MKAGKYNTRSNPSNVGLAALLAAGLMFGAAHTAMAAGTASGTSISNSATLGYSVGAIAQPAITSNTATFLVDSKVNLTVAKTGDRTSTPGANNQAVAFTVTNTGNTSQRYALTAVAGTENLTTDLASVRIFLDVNDDKAWDSGDTLYVNASTFGNVVADATLRVLIVADVPLVQDNATTAIYHLVATTVDAGTTTVTAQTNVGVVDDPTVVDVVFADSAGSATGDVANNGKHSALATYTVSTATLTIIKTSAVYSDPSNGISNGTTIFPKAIPGAVVTYTITIANGAGAATATSVSIADSLAAEITANPSRLAFATQFNDGVTTNCAATSGIVIDADGSGSGSPVCKTNAVGGDTTTDADFTNNVVNASGLSLAAGTNAIIKFQVIVQ